MVTCISWLERLKIWSSRLRQTGGVVMSDDKIALRAYLDRLSDRPREIFTTVDAADFNAQMQAAV